MRYHILHFSLLLLAVLAVNACRSRSSPLPSAPKREGGTSPATGEAKPKDARVNNPLIYRSSEGACETLLAPSDEDPFVAWAKHFPVERQGFVATSPARATSITELRKRLSVLREGMYDIVECEALTVLWLQAIGGCEELNHSAKAYEEVIGPVDVVACFAHNPSECAAPNASKERCQYLVAPILDLPHCGAETPQQKATAERILVELGLAAPGSKPCEDG